MSVPDTVERAPGQKVKGWIGVDLDGTLAHYGGWNQGRIGAPVPRMVALVKKWLAEGRDVRIVTARVGPQPDWFNLQQQFDMIDLWCVEHIGQKLQITCSKDYEMSRLYDDRAVTVEENTGRLQSVTEMEDEDWEALE